MTAQFRLTSATQQWQILEQRFEGTVSPRIGKGLQNITAQFRLFQQPRSSKHWNTNLRVQFRLALAKYDAAVPHHVNNPKLANIGATI